MIYNNKIYNTDYDIVNTLPKFYKAFTKIDSCLNNIETSDNEMNLEIITEKEILSAMKRIKTNQSPGYDNIHPLFVKSVYIT